LLYRLQIIQSVTLSLLPGLTKAIIIISVLRVITARLSCGGRCRHRFCGVARLLLLRDIGRLVATLHHFDLFRCCGGGLGSCRRRCTPAKQTRHVGGGLVRTSSRLSLHIGERLVLLNLRVDHLDASCPCTDDGSDTFLTSGVDLASDQRRHFSDARFVELALDGGTCIASSFVNDTSTLFGLLCGLVESILGVLGGDFVRLRRLRHDDFSACRRALSR